MLVAADKYINSLSHRSVGCWRKKVIKLGWDTFHSSVELELLSFRFRLRYARLLVYRALVFSNTQLSYHQFLLRPQ